jgi:hypothetical protein
MFRPYGGTYESPHLCLHNSFVNSFRYSTFASFATSERYSYALPVTLPLLTQRHYFSTLRLEAVLHPGRLFLLCRASPGHHVYALYYKFKHLLLSMMMQDWMLAIGCLERKRYNGQK